MSCSTRFHWCSSVAAPAAPAAVSDSSGARPLTLTFVGRFGLRASDFRAASPGQQPSLAEAGLGMALLAQDPATEWAQRVAAAAGSTTPAAAEAAEAASYLLSTREDSPLVSPQALLGLCAERLRSMVVLVVGTGNSDATMTSYCLQSPRSCCSADPWYRQNYKQLAAEVQATSLNVVDFACVPADVMRCESPSKACGRQVFKQHG